MHIAVLVALLFTATPSDVEITLDHGRVWLDASQSTTRSVLLEWARAGRFELIDADNIVDAPLTIHFAGVSETEALGVLLRASGGFVARRRAEASDDPHDSLFDRLAILPPSSASRTEALLPPPAAAAPPRPESVPTAEPVDPRRIIGADGLPVEDDQQGAPPASPY